MKFLKLALIIFIAGILPINFALAENSPEEKSAEYKADNSGKNLRDVNPDQLTAQDQSNSKRDMELTRIIRRAIMKENKLSTLAHNVKIVVAQNAITLKGPVKNANELQMVIAKAKAAAPKMEIVNQLEITKE